MSKIDQIKQMNFIEGLKELYKYCGLNFNERQCIDVLLSDVKKHVTCIHCPANEECTASFIQNCEINFVHHFKNN